jgi:purine-binding chemotaxis protein CheW
MILNQTTASLTNTSLSHLPTSNKHCVFRCGDSWFSVPAVAVRQIVVIPELVRIPHCHRAIAGLGRVRGEFVPVISLDTLLEIDQSNESPASACLLVLEGNCNWSLLISETIALEYLETIVSQNARLENPNNVVIGTAMFRDHIVRVLNPGGLLATAQSAFDQFWNRANDRTTPHNS